MNHFNEKDFNTKPVKLNPDDSTDLEVALTATLIFAQNLNVYAGIDDFSKIANILTCSLCKLIISKHDSNEYDDYFIEKVCELMKENLEHCRKKDK